MQRTNLYWIQFFRYWGPLTPWLLPVVSDTLDTPVPGRYQNRVVLDQQGTLGATGTWCTEELYSQL